MHPLRCPTTGNPCSDKRNLQSQMETLWSKKRYFGLLVKTNILVCYPIIHYKKIEVYRLETMDIGRLLWNNGVSGK